MIKTIIKHYKNEDFDVLAKYVSDIEPEALANEIKNIDKDLMVLIVSKFPDTVFADIFMILPVEVQDYLVENINDIVFKNFSEKLLDNDDIENAFSSCFSCFSDSFFSASAVFGSAPGFNSIVLILGIEVFVALGIWFAASEAITSSLNDE